MLFVERAAIGSNCLNSLIYSGGFPSNGGTEPTIGSNGLKFPAIFIHSPNGTIPQLVLTD